MLNIAYTCTHASIILVIFIIICYKISNLIDIIIQYDVGGCVICISNKVEYLDKEGSYINSTKEVTL